MHDLENSLMVKFHLVCNFVSKSSRMLVAPLRVFDTPKRLSTKDAVQRTSPLALNPQRRVCAARP